MQRRSLIPFLGLICILIIPLVAGCLPAPEITDIPHELYTDAAKTVSVQLTGNALLTPSSTATATPEPTATITSTPEPTPTVPSPTPTWHFQQSGEVQAPILVYYDIVPQENEPADVQANETAVPYEEFEQQIAMLHKTGYQSIPLTLLINTIIFGSEIPARPIVITFDSTSASIYEIVYPLMESYGFFGTLFVTVSHLDQDGMMTTDQIKELVENGWRVGSRGMYGYDLTSDYSLLSDEISGSRIALEEKIGIPITLFAYPYGRVDDMISSRVVNWGYEAAVGLSWYQDSKHSSQTIYYLSRFEVKPGETPEEFFARLPWQPDSYPTQSP